MSGTDHQRELDERSASPAPGEVSRDEHDAPGAELAGGSPPDADSTPVRPLRLALQLLPLIAVVAATPFILRLAPGRQALVFLGAYAVAIALLLGTRRRR